MRQRRAVRKEKLPGDTPLVRADFRDTARKLNGRGIEIREPALSVRHVDCRRQRFHHFAKDTVQCIAASRQIEKRFDVACAQAASPEYCSACIPVTTFSAARRNALDSLIRKTPNTIIWFRAAMIKSKAKSGSDEASLVRPSELRY